MAKDSTSTGSVAEKRTKSDFITLVSGDPSVIEAATKVEGARVWVELPVRHNVATGGHAKRAAADGMYAAPEGDPLREAITGPGIVLQAIPSRSFKASTVQLEVPKPKIKLG